MYKENGEIRQCNEGKYKFKLREWDDPDKTFFEICLPKSFSLILIYIFRFLDSSFLDVNIDPKWISVRVKDKLT